MIFTASNFSTTWAPSSETFQISGVIFPCWPWTYCLTLQGSLAACRTERLGEEQSSLRDLNFSVSECGGKKAEPAGSILIPVLLWASGPASEEVT